MNGLKWLLVTTKKRKKWIIPKGDIEKGMTPFESAAEEAYEEAGILGSISVDPLGHYRHGKGARPQYVQVFLLLVSELYDDWPELDIRARAWFTIDEACERLRQDDLIELVKMSPGLVDSIKMRHITPQAMASDVQVPTPKQSA